MDIVTHRFAAARRYRAAVCVVAVAFGVAGCGGAPKSTETLIPATGKVTLDGQPLAGATVSFIADGGTKGQGAGGVTKSDGTYSLSTQNGESGVPAGQYRVVITKSKNPTPETAPGAPEVMIPAAPGDETLSPTYADERNTVLKATVPASGTASNDFELKGGKRTSEVVAPQGSIIPGAGGSVGPGPGGSIVPGAPKR